MSEQRCKIVPVVLQAGKKYVRRDGAVITVEDNPHWQCAALYPFFDAQGCVYYTSSGHVDAEHTEHPSAIARPSYEVGEEYVTTDGRTQVIKYNDRDDGVFKVETADGWTYSTDGSYWGKYTDPSCKDLQDYVAAPAVMMMPGEPVDQNIGRKVRVDWDGLVFEGTVVCKNSVYSRRYCVHIDKMIEGSSGSGHTCDGNIPDGKGWNVPVEELKDIATPEPVTPGFAPPHADDALLTELGVPPAVEIKPEDYIGKRVYHNAFEAEGTIRLIKDGVYFGIEFDTEVKDCMHLLDGALEECRGWYVWIAEEGDTWRLAVSEAEAPAEAERSEASLNDVDRAAIWSALAERVSTLKEPHIGDTLDELIAARRKLNAT